MKALFFLNNILRRRVVQIFSLLFIVASLSSCGYSSKMLLPDNIKTIHVLPMKNTIDLSGEATEQHRFRVYRPGIEVDMTNAVMNRFMFDGHLKVVSKEKADAIFESKLLDYRRDPVRYNDQDEVQEYRVSVIIEYVLYRARDNKEITRQRVGGDTTFFLSGSHAITEDEAMAKAIDDTSRRVVESVTELW